MNKGTYPEPVVDAFIINNENKIFLMKSRKWSNLWVVPGGHIEIGETIDQALKREVKEETNLTIINPQLITIWEFIDGEEYHDKRHMLFLNYRVETTSKDIMLNDEGQEYVWTTKDEVLKLPLEKYSKMTIQQFPGKFFKKSHIRGSGRWEISPIFSRINWSSSFLIVVIEHSIIFI